MKTAAFFDLDGTLLTVNSAALWMDRERRAGRIGRWTMLQAALYLLGYRFGLVDIERGMLKALQTIKGEREENVRRWTSDWFHQEVAGHVAPGCWPVLDGHRKENRLVVLLTSSSLYESELAAELFRLDAVLCTRYEVVNGLFTGRLSGPISFGRGKVVLAEQFAREMQVDLDDSYFYTDSITDLPMLERVRHPHTVNPDIRLRRLAAKKRWPRLDWR
ncbi:MAG: HAD family hydrolase [Bradymonadales bacterium]|nr:HAD family hydrolase [Bradymonadales bacterium]